MELPKEIGPLKDLMNNEIGYAVPWAMHLDSQGFCWLNGDYLFFSQPGGTLEMKITKKNNSYICDIRKCQDYKWKCGRSARAGDSIQLPVFEIIGME